MVLSCAHKMGEAFRRDATRSLGDAGGDAKSHQMRAEQSSWPTFTSGHARGCDG